MSSDLLTGRVLRAAGGFYEVDIPGKAPGEASHETYLCSLRGLFKKGRQQRTQPVVVGDAVRIRALETSGANARGEVLREGHIVEVLPRRTQLGRSRFGKIDQITVANLDQVAVVMSLREPEMNLHRLDRFLVLAESNELKPLIVLNKIDLIEEENELQRELAVVREIYKPLGYPILPVSAEDDRGVEKLRAALKDKTSAFVGSSGVGKSSLAGAVQPGLHLWIGDVMEIGKGRHTTTEVSLHTLDFGGYIVDTPGIKTVSLLEVREVDLAQCFPEIRELQSECRFNDCTHDHEPGCAVREAVEEGEIVESRYDSYAKMLADQQALRPIYDRED